MRPWAIALLLICVAASGTALLRTLPTPQPEPADRDPELEARLSKLEAAVAALERSAELRAAASHDNSHAASDGVVSVQKRLERLEDWIQEQGDDSPVDPNTGISVREVEKTRRALEAIERQEMQAQVNRWVKQEQDSAAELADTLARQMNLSDMEQQSVQLIVAEESEQMGELLQELWSPQNADASVDDMELAEQWDLAVARMKELRKERDSRMEELLGKDRYERAQRMARQSQHARTRPKRENQGGDRR